ncbi:MAG: hypothetical protein ABWX82_09020 [Leifsonia sp.]
MRPDAGGFVVVDLLGRPVTDAVDWLTAEETLDATGIGYLAGPFELLLDDGTWLRVRIVEVSPDGLRVKQDDGGAIGGPIVEFRLPFPIPDRLRPLAAR